MVRGSSGASEALVGALADLRDDFDELRFLCRSAETQLADAQLELRAACLRAATDALLASQLAAARRRFLTIGERLATQRDRAARGVPTPSLIAELALAKASTADLLRVEQALLAALVGAGDWQSPSFLHSTVPMSGRQAGRVCAHWNDYKRDRHLDAEAYEHRYLHALVDQPAGLRALVTSCGMAAFTTVFSFLALEGHLDRPVIAGAALYHESRMLLERALPQRVRFVDERDTRALVRAIGEVNPSAIFLDSLSNSRSMAIPELAPVMDALRGTDTYLVVDNTCLSVACQPFAVARDTVRLIVFESLLKYAQLGLDRTNAGVIVSAAADAERLDSYREHLGTNASDVAIHALPRPDRRVLERRLARLQRNALTLVDRLHERAPAGVEIVYPGNRSHGCARAASSLAFRGGCLSIVFREPGLRRGRALVGAAIEQAARRGVALVAGSSFGFDTTRIYLTSENPAEAPFVRVAAGTEHRLEIDELADALAAAVELVSR